MYILCVFVWVRAPKNHFMSTFSFVAFLECSQKYWLDWFISTADALLVVTVLKGYHPLTQHFAQKPISPAISVLTFLNHYCFGCSWGFEDSHCKIEFNAFFGFFHSFINCKEIFEGHSFRYVPEKVKTKHIFILLQFLSQRLMSQTEVSSFILSVHCSCNQ